MSSREPPRRVPMVRPRAGAPQERRPRDDERRAPEGPRRPESGGGISGSTLLVGLFATIGVGLLVGAALFAGSAPGSPASMAPTPAPSGGASPGASLPAGAVPPDGSSPSPGATVAAAPGEVPLAVVAPVRDLRVGLTSAALASEMKAGRLAVPCGIGAITLGGSPLPPGPAACLEPAKVRASVSAGKPALGLLPAALVTPDVKVLRLDGADLFGGPAVRAGAYPLAAAATAASAAWGTFDPAEVRTIVSVGETCPNRGVSRQAVTLGKGWDWTLAGGTAKYTGTHMDRRFSGPDGKGWPVVDAVRTGNAGSVAALIADAEVTVADFECPMTASFSQADSGTHFAIDPKVAPLLAQHGVDVVTLASNHITDQGPAGLRQTLQLLRASGIKTVGAGMNLAEALAPAVVDVRGVRFAFTGLNEHPGSTRATASTAGVAWLTSTNIRGAVGAARKAGDVVIVMPQWNWPEYHADILPRATSQAAAFLAAGADDVLGNGAHWAGGLSLAADARGWHVAMASHGNFLYGQDWSRQTQEGVIVEMTFVGTHLTQVRLHPYVILDDAQPNLTTPTTDGAYVLNQVWNNSTVR